MLPFQFLEGMKDIDLEQNGTDCNAFRLLKDKCIGMMQRLVTA